MASNSLGTLTVVGGISIAAFASGFGVCLFNLDTVGECVALARSWVDVFKDFGNQIIIWFFSVLKALLNTVPQG